MPGFAVTAASQVACTHQGQVKVTPHQFRVLAYGSPVITASDITVIAGCALTSLTPPSPCVTVNFALAASSRVLIDGQPVVFEPAGAGAGLCQSAAQAPQGTPLISVVQQAVLGG
jgi:uncharacterized Zn-binding protein involved in type VI secretion